jgi:hypothetical protein
MAFDIDTYAGMREEVYRCIQCGKTKSADKLWALVQAYMLLGDELAV